jgi:hypothetical protein
MLDLYILRASFAAAANSQCNKAHRTHGAKDGPKPNNNSIQNGFMRMQPNLASMSAMCREGDTAHCLTAENYSSSLSSSSSSSKWPLRRFRFMCIMANLSSAIMRPLDAAAGCASSSSVSFSSSTLFFSSPSFVVSPWVHAPPVGVSSNAAGLVNTQHNRQHVLPLQSPIACNRRTRAPCA